MCNYPLPQYKERGCGSLMFWQTDHNLLKDMLSLNSMLYVWTNSVCQSWYSLIVCFKCRKKNGLSQRFSFLRTARFYHIICICHFPRKHQSSQIMWSASHFGGSPLRNTIDSPLRTILLVRINCPFWPDLGTFERFSDCSPFTPLTSQTHYLLYYSYNLYTIVHH